MHFNICTPSWRLDTSIFTYTIYNNVGKNNLTTVESAVTTQSEEKKKKKQKKPKTHQKTKSKGTSQNLKRQEIKTGTILPLFI